jgi:pimeloyl-ACP methyl ester carboxylesterase
VILIHGASGNLRDWTYGPARRLAENHRVIAFDRPGFGYTERNPRDGADVAVQARTLAAAADLLGANRPIVVGHSLGGAVALAWGLARPSEVAGLTVVSGASMPSSNRPGLAETLGLDEVIVSAYLTFIKMTADRGGIERFVDRAFKPQDPPPGYADYVGAPLALRDATLKANAEDIRHLNEALRRMAPEYGRLTMPVEVLHGEADWLLEPEDHAIPLAQALPRANLEIAAGVGHMAHHAATNRLQAAVARLAAIAA